MDSAALGSATRALAVLEDLRSQSRLEGVYDILQQIADVFGFSTFCLTGVPDPGRRLDGYMLMAGWPPEWFERYHAGNYIQHDPVVAMLRRTALPFAWREAVTGRTRSRMAEQVMQEAAALGMKDGVCVPIYAAHGFQAAFSLGGEAAELSEAERGALQLVGIYAHTRVLDLAAGAALPDAARLTPREAECLRWTADGKTSWAISRIINISESTVNEYLRSAQTKLGAANRTHAVAEGFRRGIIS